VPQFRREWRASMSIGLVSFVAPFSQAALPAFILGLVMSGDYATHRKEHDRAQFSLLIAVVVLSAIVPTAIAQRFFEPHTRVGHGGGRERPVAPMPPLPRARSTRSSRRRRS